MKNSHLVLCPADPRWSPSGDGSLERLLRSIQFIGAPYPGEHDYLAGERFLDLIAFMGCSPAIKLDPDDDGKEFCTIRVTSGLRSIEYRGGEHTATPRCPQCGAPNRDWKSAVDRWQQDGKITPWTCEKCHREAAPWEYNWRKSAGFGRCFIMISNIYPREAIPQQQLLDTLNSHYRVNWHFFYQF